MSDEYRRVRLWQVRATDKAILFETLPPMPQDYPGAELWVRDPSSREVWIPRSQIKHVSRNAAAMSGFQECIVDVAEWFAERENL